MDKEFVINNKSIAVDKSVTDYNDTIIPNSEILHSNNSELSTKSILDELTDINFTSKPEAFKNDVNDSKLDISRLGKDTIFFTPWRNYENVSARLIEVTDDGVVLECLIDRDNEFYEEREFRKSILEGFDLTLGKLFFLRFFERENANKIEAYDDAGLTNQNDFPKTDFKKLFDNSQLFKSKFG